MDELALSDRSPVELRQRFGLESNLLAHHLGVLEEVGLVVRTRSSGDGRRRYVCLVRGAFEGLELGPRLDLGSAVFVCTRNSARSQLAAALWDARGGTALSAGTHPANAVHRGAIGAAERVGLDLHGAMPRLIDDVDTTNALVVTVCDQAHEELGPRDGWLHWSIPDPVVLGTRVAFDRALAQIRSRVDALTVSVAA